MKVGFEAGPPRPDGRKQRAHFATKMKVMKTLADMPTDEKQPLGYDISDLIIDCEYSGYECYVDRLVRG
jgi:hypothetical protein